MNKGFDNRAGDHVSLEPHFVVQGATLCKTLWSSWWDFIWWCNDLGTDWLSNRDYPYWLGRTASPPQFILSIMRAASPGSMCIGPLDSQGWPVLSYWLACITDKGFLSLPQTCLSKQVLKSAEEVLQCGRETTGFTVRCCSFIHSPVLISICTYLISELCIELPCIWPGILYGQLLSIWLLFSVRLLWEHWCHQSDDMMTDCGVLTSDSHKTHSGAHTMRVIHPVSLSVCRLCVLMNVGVGGRQTEKSHSRLRLSPVALTVSHIS